MDKWLNLIDETKAHFSEGARSVRAYTNEKVYVITKANEEEYWVAQEEPGFPKTKTMSLDKYFKEVFGIEAKY